MVKQNKLFQHGSTLILQHIFLLSSISPQNISKISLKHCFQALLSAPNPDDPLANDVAELWKANEAEALKNARDCTRKYAMGNWDGFLLVGVTLCLLSSRLPISSWAPCHPWSMTSWTPCPWSITSWTLCPWKMIIAAVNASMENPNSSIFKCWIV